MLGPVEQDGVADVDPQGGIVVGDLDGFDRDEMRQVELQRALNQKLGRGGKRAAVGLEHELQQVLARGGVIGGSSAGASIQADYMVRGDPLGNTNMMAAGYERGLGFLKGVDFLWTLEHMLCPMLFVSSVLLALFYLIDRLAWNREAPEVRAKSSLATPSAPAPCSRSIRTAR